MKSLAALFTGLAAATLVVVGAAFLGHRSAASATAPQAARTLVITITGMAADEATPSNFAVRPGEVVKVTVVNHSPLAHTFTIPSLGLNEPILAATGAVPTTETFTFTAQRHGQLEWFCIPCNGHMHGEIYAILGHPFMHGVHWSQA